MNRLNQRRLIHLRMSRGLAVRQLARDCGIEISVLNRLETADKPSMTTLSAAALTRLADHLGVPIGTLFTDTNDNPQDPPPQLEDADAKTIGALLTALGQDTAIVAIADSLQWPSTRVHDAATALDLTLRAAGMTVYSRSGYISIRPIDDSHSDAELAVRRHPRARAKQRLASVGRSKIIYRAANTPISPHSVSSTDRVNIATLLKAGILIEDQSRCFVLSADVMESLYPDESRRPIPNA